jgi:pyruvate dehydrogenase (quinone)/pyruvate oxidase
MRLVRCVHGRPGGASALATLGPVVVEAVVDPFTPPMPPKVSLEQTAGFAESLARGEPNRGRIALTVPGDRIV